MTANHLCGEELTTLLMERQANRLDAELCTRVEHHLAACADCRALATAQRTVWQALDTLDRSLPAVSPAFDSQLLARIEAEQNGTWWRRAWLGWFAAGVPLNWKPAGAVAFAALALAAGLAFRDGAGQMSDAAMPVEALLNEHEMQQVEIVLEDVEMLGAMGSPEED